MEHFTGETVWPTTASSDRAVLCWMGREASAIVAVVDEEERLYENGTLQTTSSFPEMEPYRLTHGCQKIVGAKNDKQDSIFCHWLTFVLLVRLFVCHSVTNFNLFLNLEGISPEKSCEKTKN